MAEEEADQMPSFQELTTLPSKREPIALLTKRKLLARSFSGENEPEEDGAGGLRASNSFEK